jgi:hypothetical protein
MKQSGLLKRQHDSNDRVMHVTEHIIEQFMTDTLQIAANRCAGLGLGYDRIMQLTAVWQEVQKEYRPALNPTKDKEADVAQDHMDNELKRIIRKKAVLIPFEERYPSVKRVRYDKQYK